MLTAAQFQRKTRTVLARTFYFVRTGYIQTGERVNPDFPDVNFENHLKVYRFLAQFAKGNDILDIGCGLGYGTDYLRPFAHSIVGIDISKRAIGFARHRYPETQFLLMDAEALRLSPESVNLVISSENFEHLANQEKSLREIARVLAPGGMCFLATPNCEVSGARNPYHTHEFTRSELAESLSRHFVDVEVWPSQLRTPDRASLGKPPQDLKLFGEPVDQTYLSNTHSLFSFSRRPKEENK